MVESLAESCDGTIDSFESVLNDSTKWDSQPVNKAHFSNIHIGTATSEYQYSGKTNCPNNQWAKWEEHLPPEKQSGKAWDLWNRPAECVQILKDLNMTSFRFSVEWSKIQPEPGVIDHVALQHYVDFCKLLKAEGIEPMVTLHHFTNPLWFEKMGAFEKEENIHYFVEYSKVVYAALCGDVDLFCTINEPTVVSFEGYVHGEFPPNRTNPFLAARVLKNLLKAHCETYRELKSIDSRPQVGIVHQVVNMLPYRKWNPIDIAAASFTTRGLHGAAMDFFETGKFDHWGQRFEEKDIHSLNDFIGVNCYARPLYSVFTPTTSTHYSHEEMTLMPLREDPAAIYVAIMEVFEKTQKPIYVTEVGISTGDEVQLHRYMERALYAIYQAQQKGVDLRGIYWWSLFNNWEWNRTWDHFFGICHDDGTPREGATPLLQQAAALNPSSGCIPA